MDYELFNRAFAFIMIGILILFIAIHRVRKTKKMNHWKILRTGFCSLTSPLIKNGGSFGSLKKYIALLGFTQKLVV